ncbi:zinc-ribbon domain-containing protein [Streptomyces sp. PA03-2a]|uniref:zinc-ribbon domain-containing protein n=1 Tax=Streptomyces sp. PA03-2a TaxID=3028701 RepID=UPI0029BADF07|nr:zinc-ribbon domain-containing protein [Streptomyces sp. PA03-2a]MDX2733450.1 zinc-ribbon domain-containing protein [Streptomyces sp. PA03-2a]
MSLAEAYPQVAARWFQERNGGLTPEKALPKMAVDVWWRCPAGHEWQERIGNRMSIPKWENGDVAARRECVGYRVSYTYPECGCTAMVTAEAAAKRKTRCWNCYQQRCRENEPRIKAELSAAAKAAAGRAGELLDAVPLPEDMSAPLATEWRWWASKHLQGAIAAEEVLGKEGAREDMLSSVSAMGARLLPSKEDAGRAAAADGVLRLLDQAHWAEGWLQVRTGRAPRPVPEEGLEGVAIMLGNILANWTGRRMPPRPSRGTERTATARRPAEITRSLTEAVASFRDENVIGPIAKYARAYRELRVPVIPDGKGRWTSWSGCPAYPTS